jgi:hypothetical protein
MSRIISRIQREIRGNPSTRGGSGEGAARAHWRFQRLVSFYSQQIAQMIQQVRLALFAGVDNEELMLSFYRETLPYKRRNRRNRVSSDRS